MAERLWPEVSQAEFDELEAKARKLSDHPSLRNKRFKTRAQARQAVADALTPPPEKHLLGELCA